MSLSSWYYLFIIQHSLLFFNLITLIIIIHPLASCQSYYLTPELSPLSTIYTIRSGRAIENNPNNHNNINVFHEPSSHRPQHYESSKFYRAVQTTSSLVNNHTPKQISSQSHPSTSIILSSNNIGNGGGIGSTSTTNTATVIKHPSTCSYDRSQTACTFSLLCYLADGVPIEGCEENPSVTCCYIRLKSAQTLSSKSDVGPSIIYQPYHPTDSSSITTTSHQSPPSITTTTTVSHNIHSGYHHPSQQNYIITSTKNNNVKYRNTNTPLVSADSSVASTKIHGIDHQTSNYNNFESSFNLKNNLLSPYEQQKNGNLQNKHEFDYAFNNAIRRTRPESMKSVFQEIVNRKFYARNYDIEDICGKPMSKPRSRIIGGQDAYFGEFPWQVHIKITKHQCGGALINSRFIVTAAHCIYQAPIHQLNVIIGAHDIEDHRFQDIPPQYFRVSKVILHPNFRFSASHPDRYDIALIKLDSPVRFSDSVLPVCLPEENLYFEGRKGVVTGWGKTDPALSNRYGTRLLQKVDVPIIDNEKCETWHRTRGIDLRIFSEMMCAGYEDGQKDACVGDSGGPLVININGRWTLAGITSAGFGCAQSRQPGIYHRVSHTVEWIRQTLRDEEENNLI